MVSSPLYHEIYQPLLYDKKLQITRSISLNNGNRAIKITYSQ